MHAQLDLLADYPRARNTDVITSHEAAEAIKESGVLGKQQHEVLEALRRWPGITSLELAGHMGASRYTTGRRLSELTPTYARRGDVELGEFRIVDGRRHVLWFPK